MRLDARLGGLESTTSVNLDARLGGTWHCSRGHDLVPASAANLAPGHSGPVQAPGCHDHRLVWQARHGWMSHATVVPCPPPHHNAVEADYPDSVKAMLGRFGMVNTYGKDHTRLK